MINNHSPAPGKTITTLAGILHRQHTRRAAQPTARQQQSWPSGITHKRSDLIYRTKHHLGQTNASKAVRALNDLEDLGIITQTRTHIRVLDPHGLHLIANGLPLPPEKPTTWYADPWPARRGAIIYPDGHIRGCHNPNCERCTSANPPPACNISATWELDPDTATALHQALTDAYQNSERNPMTPELQALNGALCEEAIRIHRCYSKIIHERDEHSFRQRTWLAGEISGLHTALCHLNGWNSEHDADKGGKADELILSYWEHHYPNEWADPDEPHHQTLATLRADLIARHPELDHILKPPTENSLGKPQVAPKNPDQQGEPCPPSPAPNADAPATTPTTSAKTTAETATTGLTTPPTTRTQTPT